MRATVCTHTLLILSYAGIKQRGIYIDRDDFGALITPGLRSSIGAMFGLILYPHRPTILDFIICLGNMVIVPLLMITPLTPGWRFIRGAIFAPLTSSIFLYVSTCIAQYNLADRWGVPVLMGYFFAQCWSIFLFWPPEDNVYRLIPRITGQTHLHNGHEGHDRHNGNPHGHSKSTTVDLVAEPVPEPWTLAKFYWANSRWWSWRCIGWSDSCPLPQSAQRHPYTHQSSRKDYLIARFKYLILTVIVGDFIHSYIRLSSQAPFFQNLPGAQTYDEMSTWERAKCSLITVGWIWFSLELPQVQCSIFFVGAGGILGWEGEIWSPWGWPPMFASSGNFFRRPTLAYTWSTSWHQYNRSILYSYGWRGIGETILRLPPTGLSVKLAQGRAQTSLSNSKVKSELSPQIPHTSASSSTVSSGRTSPTHPIPTAPSQSIRSLHTPDLINNLIKSAIVFFLTGVLHDQSTYFMLKDYFYPGSSWLATSKSMPSIHVSPGRNPNFHWTDAIVTTPFFAIQPLALAFEALVKRQWRAYKVRHHPEWLQASREPPWLVYAERATSFTFTWVWLGWSAHWFVAGIPRTGAYAKMVDESASWSPVSGLIWGVWYR
ncbi:hypothetical protein BD324DRAFT_623677 [Kockovaella imperatae]|uniref:Wax synthase domain-containing protein n=1 Tax=Kockovaella imperatae TaxID=4999 RepID=A0A1Y1UIT5_9TREE|nr:hypothetical protein BD324DRAFT_623677 [Kockovaella imperatae]ORX37889.1 hypothetical protein BD324DRAFT_623677 [Kockovaella imperatae]